MSDTVTIAETVLVVKRRRWLRYLRITVSVFFGVLTVALCVLWVRSYWNYDVIRRVGWLSQFDVTSDCGALRVIYTPEFHRGRETRWMWLRFDAKPTLHTPRISYNRNSEETQAEFPYLLPFVILLAAAVVSSRPARFSLRTMFIATTFVAVVLGLAVWTRR